MIKVFLKPVAGRLVPHPERSGYLSEQGEEVVINSYWQRRINDGDVVKGKQAVKATETKGGK